MFWIRFDIYKKKFLIKFINNFISQLGPFFFYSIGGYLVLQGQMTIGALIAVVGAQKDIVSPWRELLGYYQTLYDVKIKYEQTVSQFVPPGLRDERLQTDEPKDVTPLQGELRATGISLHGEGGETILDGLSFTLTLPTHLAIVGPAGSGKEELTLLLAGLLEPTAGRVTIGGVDLHNLPEAVLGRRIGYVGNPTMIFAGTIEDNILYGLKYRPQRPRPRGEDALSRYEREMHEANRSGNSPHDPQADWVDYTAAGIEAAEQRVTSLVALLELVRMDGDVFGLGLRSAIPPGAHIELKERLLEARLAMQQRLADDAGLSRLVEAFDPERYNSNASLAENLLFGSPVGHVFDPDDIADEPYVRETLEATGLLGDLYDVGFRLAQTMLELFADLPPDHDYFRQFSFIAPEDLHDLSQLADARGRRTSGPAVGRGQAAAAGADLQADRGPASAGADHAGAHGQGAGGQALFPRASAGRIMPAPSRSSIRQQYNEAITIQENVIFGKIAFGQAQAPQRIAELITGLLEQLELRTGVMAVGLDSPVGIGGSRLSVAQRQKLGLARAILKRPDILVLFDAVGPLDFKEQIELRDGILGVRGDQTVIWALQHDDWVEVFDQVLELQEGRLVRQSPTPDADGPDVAATKLVTAE